MTVPFPRAPLVPLLTTDPYCFLSFISFPFNNVFLYSKYKVGTTLSRTLILANHEEFECAVTTYLNGCAINGRMVLIIL